MKLFHKIPLFLKDGFPKLRKFCVQSGFLHMKDSFSTDVVRGNHEEGIYGMVIRSSSCYLYGGSVTLMNRIQVGLLDTSSGSPFPPQSFPMHTKLLHAYHPTHLGHWLIKEGLQNLSHGIVLLWGTLFSQGLSGMKISNNKKVAEKRQCLLGFNLIWNMYLWDLVT